MGSITTWMETCLVSGITVLHSSPADLSSLTVITILITQMLRVTLAMSVVMVQTGVWLPGSQLVVVLHLLTGPEPVLADGPDWRKGLPGPVMIVVRVVVVGLQGGPRRRGRLRPGRDDGVTRDGSGGHRVVEGEVSGALLYLGVLLLPGGLVGAEDGLETAEIAQDL